MSDPHGAKRPVVAGVRRFVRDYRHEGYSSIVALAENCVIAVEVRHGDFGDEELRSVRVRTGVGLSLIHI